MDDDWTVELVALLRLGNENELMSDLRGFDANVFFHLFVFEIAAAFILEIGTLVPYLYYAFHR